MEYPRADDPQAMMNALGAVVPAILREAVDSGFFNYRKSRDLDPTGHAELTASSRANVLIDRIMAVARDLINCNEDKNLVWRSSTNQRATEIYLGPFIAFRIKRVKRNRGGMSTSVNTQRQIKMKSPSVLDHRGQLVLDFPDLLPPLRDEDRIWLTVGYDLDEVEEIVASVGIGLEMTKFLLWRVPLLESEPDILASLSTPLADRMNELRSKRLA